MYGGVRVSVRDRRCFSEAVYDGQTTAAWPGQYKKATVTMTTAA